MLVHDQWHRVAHHRAPTRRICPGWSPRAGAQETTVFRGLEKHTHLHYEYVKNQTQTETCSHQTSTSFSKQNKKDGEKKRDKSNKTQKSKLVDKLLWEHTCLLLSCRSSECARWVIGMKYQFDVKHQLHKHKALSALQHSQNPFKVFSKPYFDFFMIHK